MPKLVPKPKLKPGETVTHKRFGRGIVLRSWGSWEDPESPGEFINGNDIYDVWFAQGLQCVHESRLS